MYYLDEFHWIIHLFATTLLLFLSSEVFQAVFPAAWDDDVNLTILWILLVMASLVYPFT